MVSGGAYGTSADLEASAASVPRNSRGAIKLFGTVSLCVVGLVVALVYLGQHSAPGVVALEGTNLASEQASIKAAQHNLDRLMSTEKQDEVKLSHHRGEEAREAQLSKASLAKAHAKREIAHALLETVKQHSSELAAKKERHIEKKARMRAAHDAHVADALKKKADAAQALMARHRKTADHATKAVEKEERKLKSAEKHKNKLMDKEALQKLKARKVQAKANEEAQMNQLGDASAKALKRRARHLRHKAARLGERMDKLMQKRTTERNKVANAKKFEASEKQRALAAKRKETALLDKAHKIQAQEERDQDKETELQQDLEQAKEKVHAKDYRLEHAQSRRHEASTALERAQHHLKEAERRIYLSQTRGEAVASDHKLTDADLGLV